MSDSEFTGERWRTLERLIDGALDRAPGERAGFLEAACGDDATLHAAAARLLDACLRAASPDGLFATPAATFAAPLLADVTGREDADAAEAGTAPGELLRAALAGRYDIEGELGRGGMASVFRARDVRHERAVAVKVVEPHASPGGAVRFLREIRTTARLTHPHVLGVHDSGEAEGLLYYVMPYVDGETLRERLVREGGLPLDDALRLLRELADALAYAHARGVVHCDLKPENVLLSEGHAVVADFGIARAIAAVTSGQPSSAPGISSNLGTPAYMAPEQATPGIAADHRADLYALGVIAYEMLIGTHPFPRRTSSELLQAHRTEMPPPPGSRRPDAPPALADLVMRLLAKDPARRPQSAREVLGVLERADTRTDAQPRGARVMTVAAVIALLAIAGAWWRSTATAPAAVTDVRTLAVLPFVNAGGDRADEYFSDGMTDELAHALGALPGVRLAGRTSTYAFKSRPASAQEVGRALQVGAIVTGTVRRAGERLRVSAQLVGTTDGRVLWDSIFESRTGDVFEVQDELARAMRAALAPALGALGTTVPAAAGRGTADQEAYDLYLKGRYHFLARGTDNVAQAISYYRRASERDSGFARAHAGLALAYGVLPSYVPAARDSIPALVDASAARAFALDSMLADAHLAMGLSLDLRLRLSEAEQYYRRALALEPSNAFGYHLLGFALNGIGRTDEAIVVLRRAAQLDPLAKSAGTAAAAALLSARRFPESIAESRRILALDSTFPLALGTLAMAQAFAGQLDSAVQMLERGLQLYPDAIMSRSTLLYVYAALGRWADAAPLREAIRGTAEDPSAGTAAGFAELVFGNREPLVRLLATEAGQRGWYDTHGGFGCNPLLDPLWVDPRFRAAMAAQGVPPCPLARPWDFTPPSAP